ncbi:MAG: VOC family protein [Oscillospiraceae bacterium]|nr:VOC family protein [Oscillospiraceae bacterium]
MIKGFTLGDISIDCREPERLREFYANVSGWEKQTMFDCPALITGTGLAILFMGCDFEYTPPIWPEESGKQQKQMHFNFGVDDLISGVDEATKFGAIKAEHQYGEHYVVMIDPEGHPFCLCQN